MAEGGLLVGLIRGGGLVVVAVLVALTGVCTVSGGLHVGQVHLAIFVLDVTVVVG